MRVVDLAETVLHKLIETSFMNIHAVRMFNLAIQLIDTDRAVDIVCREILLERECKMLQHSNNKNTREYVASMLLRRAAAAMDEQQKDAVSAHKPTRTSAAAPICLRCYEKPLVTKNATTGQFHVSLFEDIDAQIPFDTKTKSFPNRLEASVYAKTVAPHLDRYNIFARQWIEDMNLDYLCSGKFAGYEIVFVDDQMYVFVFVTIRAGSVPDLIPDETPLTQGTLTCPNNPDREIFFFISNQLSGEQVHEWFREELGAQPLSAEPLHAEVQSPSHEPTSRTHKPDDATVLSSSSSE